MRDRPSTAGDVFIVDDTPANLDLLDSILYERGYRVRVANSGRRALAAIRSTPPEIIMLDIQMPEMDGYEVCRQLKADPATSAIPVIFISALDDVFDKVRAFRAGGVDYVTKPFQAEEVLARVESQLQLFRLRRELERRNEELARKNEELVAEKQRTEIAFTAMADLLPGTSLDDRYRIDEKIGTGGFGVVYRATHLGIGRRVAVKILRPLPGRTMPEALERFRREGISACRVDHPNAISVLDSGTTSAGIPYLVMELLEGRTLMAELRERGLLSTARCAELLAPICDALAAAHDAGLVHRDVKPDNIFLHRTERGEVVKVVDFGIAKLAGDPEGADTEMATAEGLVFGTPYYTSPERLLCEPYDGRADVYSLGVMLYVLLTGRIPFQQTEAGGATGGPLRCLTEPPPPLRDANPAVPAEVEAVVLRAMSRQIWKRPTARELAEEFLAATAAAGEAAAEAPPAAASEIGEEIVPTDVLDPSQIRNPER
jgi:CheY-like chemotaxis protein